MQDNIVYFDNAATTFPKPEEVYSFMDKFYRECGVNVGRGQHKLSSKANHLMEETRQLILDLFHCSNKQVVFTSTATEAINTILFGLHISSESTVYLSPFEHNAVTRTLHHLQKQTHFRIEYLSVEHDTLDYNLEQISQQFTNSTPYAVIISHASNVCGAVAPISEIFHLAKEYQAITVVDMCQTAGLVDTDLKSDDFDYAIFEGHKTLYAPMGIGGFITKQNSELPAFIYGGTGIESANQNMPLQIPVRFEAGSHNIAAIAGLHAALNWINSISIAKLYQQETQNRNKLINLLKKYKNIHIIEPICAIGVVSCIFNGYSSDNIGQIMSEHNIAVRTGLHCAPTAHKFLGTFPEGTVRFSVSYFNTDSDFKQLSSVLDFIEENS